MFEMQMIPFSGLSIEPGIEAEGYDEQKDLIERGAKKMRSIYIKNGKQDTVVRAIPTAEKGKLFTVFMDGDSMQFGIYEDGAVTQDMIYGHPPILIQHIDRLCDRVENDLQGRLKYKDDPDIEKAWHICLDMKFEQGVASIVEDKAMQL